MRYNDFSDILNKTIFENSKGELIRKIALNPNRYVGLFRPTKPHAKILQNLLQSHEIRFGDAFEKILELYFTEMGYQLLNKRIVTNSGEELDIDQCFQLKNTVYFIEQKIRDDHDSTKKRGQINNFRVKLNHMVAKHPKSNIVGIFYFVDASLQKNKNYYLPELAKMSSKPRVELPLFYGADLFNFLKRRDIWDEIIAHLKRWKKDTPELPEVNFDIDANSSFDEIKDLSPNLYKRIFTDDAVFNEIMLTISPQKATLHLLLNYFITKSANNPAYKVIADLLQKRLI